MPGLGGSGTAYSKASHIPGPRAGAAPFALKAHPLCLQYAELGEPLNLYIKGRGRSQSGAKKV